MKTSFEGLVEVGNDIYRWRFNNRRGYFSLSRLDETRLFVKKLLLPSLTENDIITLIQNQFGP